MKVFLKTQYQLSIAMDRIVSNLIRYKSSKVIILNSPEEADLAVLHVIGYEETAQSIRRLTALGKKYAMIQYCLRSTEAQSAQEWIPLWTEAAFVWSYYDLPKLCKEEGLEFPDTPFLFAPLGVDTQVFSQGLSLAKYPHKVLTTGTVAPSECIDLVNAACAQVDTRMGAHMHVGILTETTEEFNGSIVHYEHEIPDNRLAQLYRQTEYVCGLRRVEGFELPAAEGLLCGTIPILFDKPHYRDWFGDFGALFIKEGTDDEIIQSLVEIFQKPKSHWPPRDIEGAKKQFDWQHICETFWEFANELVPVDASTSNVQVSKSTRRLLWIGDAVVSTGFAKCTHHILETVRHEWDTYVLGLNYFGDPHQYPYPIFPCIRGTRGDIFGLSRIKSLIDSIRPELVIVQNDPWNFPEYMKAIGNVPTVGVVAVDGKNCRGEGLNGLLHAIFWTDFGAKEAALGGYRGSSTVIPLGVDREIFKPIRKELARQSMGLPQKQSKGFIVGNINRNQARKRLDLTIQYFCEWVKTYRVDDAYLYLHIAPTADVGYDASQLMRYYGLTGRLILAEPDPGFGIAETALPFVYNSFDVQVTTTQGEGFGLTTLEGMACGIPQILPNWSALGDLFSDSCNMVSCPTTACTPNNINAVGGVPDKDEFIGALNSLYSNEQYRSNRSEQVLQKASEARFVWKSVGDKYIEALENVFAPKVMVSSNGL